MHVSGSLWADIRGLSALRVRTESLRLALVNEGGFRIDTLASGSIVGASSLVQLDGDVLTALDSRCEDDHEFRSRHLERVSAALDEVRGWTASVSRIVRSGVVGLGLIPLILTGLSGLEVRDHAVRGCVGVVLWLAVSVVVPLIARQLLRRCLGLGVFNLAATSHDSNP